MSDYSEEVQQAKNKRRGVLDQRPVPNNQGRKDRRRKASSLRYRIEFRYDKPNWAHIKLQLADWRWFYGKPASDDLEEAKEMLRRNRRKHKYYKFQIFDTYLKEPVKG